MFYVATSQTIKIKAPMMCIHSSAGSTFLFMATQKRQAMKDANSVTQMTFSNTMEA